MLSVIVGLEILTCTLGIYNKRYAFNESEDHQIVNYVKAVSEITLAYICRKSNINHFGRFFAEQGKQ